MHVSKLLTPSRGVTLARDLGMVFAQAANYNEAMKQLVEKCQADHPKANALIGQTTTITKKGEFLVEAQAVTFEGSGFDEVSKDKPLQAIPAGP